MINCRVSILYMLLHSQAIEIKALTDLALVSHTTLRAWLLCLLSYTNLCLSDLFFSSWSLLRELCSGDDVTRTTLGHTSPQSCSPSQKASPWATRRRTMASTTVPFLTTKTTSALSWPNSRTNILLLQMRSRYYRL